MDTIRKQLLTECVDFFQDNLSITWPLLHKCVEEGIFSIQEGQQIWVSLLHEFDFCLGSVTKKGP